MEFKEAVYPVDKVIFDRIIAKRGMKAAAMSREMGYSDGTLSQACSVKRISRRLAAALFNTYGITPNDYAPKIPGVNAPKPEIKPEPKVEPEIGVMRFDAKGKEITSKPKIDDALLADGVYCIEFVDVRPGRVSGGKAEGYRFVTIATGGEKRMPFYFSLYDKEPGGEIVNDVGKEWLRHLLRVVLGEDYRDDSDVKEVVGRKCWAYLMIYEKNGKRYNRTVWVEPMGTVNYGEPEGAEPMTWQDFLNVETDTETLLDALEYIVGEIRLRTNEDS